MSNRERYAATLRARYLKASASPVVLSKYHRAACREVLRMREVARLFEGAQAWAEAQRLVREAEAVSDEAYRRCRAATDAALERRAA